MWGIKAQTSRKGTVTAFRGESNPLSNLYPLKTGTKIKLNKYSSLENCYKAMKAKHYRREAIIPDILKIERGLNVMKYVDRVLDEETDIDLENVEEWKEKRTNIM